MLPLTVVIPLPCSCKEIQLELVEHKKLPCGPRNKEFHVPLVYFRSLPLPTINKYDQFIFREYFSDIRKIHLHEAF